MSLRPPYRVLATGTAAFALGLAAPALASEPHGDPAHGAPYAHPGWTAPHDQVPQSPVLGPPPEARAAWLSECRSRLIRRDSGWDGALIGGAIGGIAGNRIAGRGHRTVGTLAGAAVGTVAGAAIDRAEDSAATRAARDECERYLDDYYAYHAAYARGPWNQTGYASGCCMQPAAMPARAPTCREDVRYVTEYVTVPGRRVIPRRPQPDKRVRIVPDKRVRTN